MLLMVNILFEGSLHVALAPPHLHGIPARARHLHRGPPCTTHDTAKYANSHVMHCACTLASLWMADH